MIILRADIKKFRGFVNVEISLGEYLTVIAGQNGTQKTTVLGILTQPFTITAEDDPMKNEKPLCGGSYKSAFNSKFKLSTNFDKPKTHEWTLYLSNGDPFTVESIARSKGNPEIRFWKKASRDKGSGYIQLPVIFLSLKRLFPIGEDEKLVESSDVELTSEEEDFFKKWHNKILISNDHLLGTNYLESSNKNTLGINTVSYDWRQNSAGQDNIGKILLAIMSFKRLKEKYQNYKGGILAIDEIDATLYPGSQLKLIEALRHFSSKYKIQIILTTHSLSILETVCSLQEQFKLIPAAKEQIKVVFLEKKNALIKPIQDVTFNTIRNRLNVTLAQNVVTRINVFTEDKEGIIFAKAILKGRSSRLKFVDCSLPFSSLIDLASRKVPSFIFPHSIIILDGDIKLKPSVVSKVRRIKNILVLPSEVSPERMIAAYLHALDDESTLWHAVNADFNKQYCFRDYSLYEIETDRSKAKSWFNSHLQIWGVNATKVLNFWIRDNPDEVNKFIGDFVELYNKFAKEWGIETL